MTEPATAGLPGMNNESEPPPATTAPVSETPAPAYPVPTSPGSASVPTSTGSAGRRAERRIQTDKGSKAATAGTKEATAAIWRKWLAVTLTLGAIMGAAWFVLAPGGAIYGKGTDFATWFPRDAALALLLLVAGLLSAALLLREGRKDRRVWASATPTLALLVGGLAGSVLAWRIGVFAGDLFQTVPANLPSPSMIFSLRSPSVLLLWPLASAALLFVAHLIGYYFARPLDDSELKHELARSRVFDEGVQQAETR